MRNLIRVSKIDEAKVTPIKQSTFYKWHHEGRHLEIFVSIGKRNLFVDLDRLGELMVRKSESAKDLNAA